MWSIFSDLKSPILHAPNRLVCRLPVAFPVFGRSKARDFKFGRPISADYDRSQRTCDQPTQREGRGHGHVTPVLFSQRSDMETVHDRDVVSVGE